MNLILKNKLDISGQNLDAYSRIKYDVVIIGSGAGGGTLAYALATKGMRVLLVERGISIPKEDDNWTEKGALGNKYRTRKNPINHFYVGGATKLYGAALYRLRAQDFVSTSHSNGASPLWPISYDELEPYYCKAEQLYRVHGSLDEDPTEPFHSMPYPYNPISHEPFIQTIVDKLKQNGHKVSSIPRGIDVGPNRTCIFCSTCDGYACKVHGKMDTEVAAILPALQTGNLDLVSEAECLRLTTNSSGTKIIEADIRQRSQVFKVTGHSFVVSGGVKGSPQLLFKSKCSSHPNGLANSSGLVGRYLCGHNAQLLFCLNGLTKIPKLHQKTFALNEFYHGSATFPAALGVIQAAGQIPVWMGFNRLVQPLMRMLASRSLLVFFMNEVLPSYENRIFLEENGNLKTSFTPNNLESFYELRKIAINLFKNAGFPIVLSRKQPLLWHPVGTCRFGRDPQNSVLDQWCRTHDIDNLYVVDGSFLPSAGAVNTALTVMAQALRVGEHLLSK